MLCGGLIQYDLDFVRISFNPSVADHESEEFARFDFEHIFLGVDFIPNARRISNVFRVSWPCSASTMLFTIMSST